MADDKFEWEPFQKEDQKDFEWEPFEEGSDQFEWEPFEEESTEQSDAAAAGAWQGATFEFGDEIEGFIGAVTGDGYQETRDEARRRNKQLRDEWSKTYLAGEVAGGITTSVLAAMATGGASAVAQGGVKAAAVGLAKTGAVEGTLAGFGAGEGGVKEHIVSTTLGTVIGGAAGGALGALGAGAPQLWKRLSDGTASSIEKKAAVDLVGLTDDKVMENQAFDDMVFNSMVGDDGKINVPVERVMPTGAGQLGTSGENAHAFLKGIFGENTEDFIEQTMTRRMIGKNSPHDNKQVDKAMNQSMKLANGEIDEAAAIEVADMRSMYAAQSYRNEVLNFINDTVNTASKRVNQTTAGKKIGSIEVEPTAGASELASRHNDFMLLRDQGAVNRGSWDTHKTGIYASQAVIDSNQIKLGRDPLNHVLSKFKDMQIVGRMSDDVTGLDVEKSIHRMQTGVIKKSSFEFAFKQSRLTARNAALKEHPTLSPKETSRAISESIEAGTPTEAGKMYSEIFEQVRDEMNKSGANIKKLEGNYIPHYKLNGVEWIEALEKQYDVLKIAHKSTDEIDDLISSMRVPEELDGIIDNEIVQYIMQLEGHLNIQFKDADAIVNAIESGILRDKTSIRSASKTTFGSAMQRKGDMPDWAREWNINKLVTRYVDNAGKMMFIQPVAKQIDNQIPLLMTMGQRETADMLHKYRMDNLGLYRGSTGSEKMSSWRMEKILDNGGSEGKTAAAFEAYDFVKYAIYPNLLGLSPKAVLRNLTQPITMTVGEMGWLAGTPHLLGAYGDALMSIAKRGPKGSWNDMLKEMEPYNLIKKELDFETGMEGITEGVIDGSRGMTWTKEKIQSVSNATMFLFSKSDESNRIITFQMSKRLANKAIKGTLNKAERTSMNELPLQVQQRIKRLMSGKYSDSYAEGMTRDMAITKTLSDHFVGNTQLIYGKAAMHEFGRNMGPLMTMMTKWPVAVGSDIHYKFNNQQRMKIVKKYIGPYLAASFLTNMALDEDSSYGNYMVGKRGFQAWMPVESVFGLPDIVTPLNMGAVFNILEGGKNAASELASGRWDNQDKNKLKGLARRSMEQYVPLVGGVSAAFDRSAEIRDDMGLDFDWEN